MMMRDTPAAVQALPAATGADREILVQQACILGAVGEPTAVPGAVYAEPQPDRIDFLTH
jgi:hypothetical protein